MKEGTVNWKRETEREHIKRKKRERENRGLG
jgi:hypothetical protein